MRILGLDPGLRTTGWGVIESDGQRLHFVDAGTISVSASDPMEARLAGLHKCVLSVTDSFAPAEVSVEETFVNRNPASALKLGQARGAVLLAPGLRGISVAEYAPNAIKKAVTGSGHAAKEQVRTMVGILLPGMRAVGFDAADALATAICHSHLRETEARWRSREVEVAR